MADDSLAAARDALARWDWPAALSHATAAAAEDAAAGAAEADRLDVLAEASWWVGRLDDCIAARERAYALYENAGRARPAGLAAVWLYEHHQMKVRPAMAGGWLRRARRWLAGEPESVEYGNLLLREGESVHGGGDLDRARALADDALAIARRVASADLEAEALQTIGRVLIDAGRVADGLGHLDEAMLFAVEGRLRPYTTGKVYCSLISACEQLGDVRRAAEWTDATMRWSEDHPLAIWPGLCRVHRAAVLQLRGDWSAAEEAARKACDDLATFHVPNAAAGYVEVGEIRRRLGDLDGAEEAFAKAEELTGHRGAGLALLRLAQGNIEAAKTIIASLLSEQSWNQLARGKLLPARVQIAVAASDMEGAAEAADELERIAVAFDSPALLAAARSARGRVELAKGDSATACVTLRDALRRWQELEVPYEVATVRLLLGQACRHCGDEGEASRSFARAATIFDELGAAIDARDTRRLTALDAAAGVPGAAGAAPLPGGLTEREAEVLALVAAGRTNKEVAAGLHLSERTVARHLSNIFTKIGVTTRTGATAFAYEHRLVH